MISQKLPKICHGDVGVTGVSLLSDNPWAEPSALKAPRTRFSWPKQCWEILGADLDQ